MSIRSTVRPKGYPRPGWILQFDGLCTNSHSKVLNLEDLKHNELLAIYMGKISQCGTNKHGTRVFVQSYVPIDCHGVCKSQDKKLQKLQTWGIK